MRFDTPVKFVVKESVYDANTGNYTDTVTSETTSITARFQNHIEDNYTDIVIGGKTYKVDYISPKRVKDVFVLSRV